MKAKNKFDLILQAQSLIQRIKKTISMLELKKVAKLVGVLVDADLIFVSTSILYMLSESDSIHIQNMTAHM